MNKNWILVELNGERQYCHHNHNGFFVFENFYLMGEDAFNEGVRNLEIQIIEEDIPYGIVITYLYNKYKSSLKKSFDPEMN